MKLQVNHLITGGVVVILALLALDYGGFTPSVTAAVTIALWWAIALGLALDLFPRSWIPRASAASGFLLILLAALAAVSIGWASDQGLAFTETVQIAMFAGAFLLTIFLSRRGDGRAWMTGLAFGIFTIVLLALVSRFFPGLGDDRELTATLGEIVGGRLSWPLGYWNAIGAMTALYAVLATYFGGSAASSRLWRSAATATLPAALAVFYLCSSRGALVAAVAGLVLLVALGPARTQKLGTVLIGFAGGVTPVFVASRSFDLVHAQPTAQADEQGLILLAVTAAATAFTFLVRYLVDEALSRRSIPKGFGWGATGLVALFVLVGVALANPVQRFETFTEIPTETPGISEESAYATEHLLGGGGNGRWQLWASAFRAAEEDPLGGIGAGGYAAWFKQDGEIWFKTVDAHSTPLQVLAELGIPGLLLFVAFGLTVLGIGITRLRRGPYTEKLAETLPESNGGSEPDWGELPVWISLLLTGLIAVSIDWSLEFPVMSIPMMITAAMLCGPSYRVEPTPARETRKATLLLTAILVPLAAVVIVMGWKQYSAASLIEGSQEAFRGGDTDRALSEAREAIDATPWAGLAYSQVASILLSADRPGAALSYSITATRKAPPATSFWIQRARIESRLGLNEAALRSIRMAERTDPGAPIWGAP